jgi:hypothetical protein
VIRYGDLGPGAQCPTGCSLEPVTTKLERLLVSHLCLRDHQCGGHTALLGGGLYTTICHANR